MYTLTKYKQLLDKINESDNTRIKNELFSEFFSSVEQFVIRANEEKEFVRGITEYEKKLRKLNKKKVEHTPEEIEEIEETQKLLSEAKAIEKTIELKKKVLKDVRVKIKTLRQLTKK